MPLLMHLVPSLLYEETCDNLDLTRTLTLLVQDEKFLEAVQEMDQECLKQHGCEFVMNPPPVSHVGGTWERQIRTIQSVLTSILDQSSRRLDSSSLRTYLYEVMAIINSRP